VSGLGASQWCLLGWPTVSYMALATDRFDQVVRFYGEGLGFPIVDEWDRAHGRGRRFNLGGLRLEILDNARERRPLRLGEPADRFHIVVEVEDIEAARRHIAIPAPPAAATSWGASLFQVRDPDGVPVTFLKWDMPTDNRS
jgi:catechol 2,3-dioxygenase-like lactoylglutathione lyase family enzyme